MATSMFFLGIFMVIVCTVSMPPAFLLYYKTKKVVYLYLGLLLTTYLVELIELLYIAQYRLPEVTPNPNLINFPVLRILTAFSLMLLDFLILLQIVNIRFRKRYFLLFVPLVLFCTYIAWLPRSMMTTWLFYAPRQFYRYGYCIFYVVRACTEKNSAVKKRINHFSFLIMGVFLLNSSVLLEDSLIISHIESYLIDMLSMTERNVSENLLWLFICIYSLIHCVRTLNALLSDTCCPTPQQTVTSDAPIPDYGSVSGDTLMAFTDYCKLTPRETQILRCLLQYKTTQEICEELQISMGTVKTHTHNIYMKAEVNSKNELIRALTEFKQQDPQTGH